MKKRTKAKIKNGILLSITGMMIAMAIFSIAMIDMFHWIIFLALGVSLTWLVLFSMANGWFELNKGDK